MKALFFVLLFGVSAFAQEANYYHDQLDRCRNNTMICMGHILIDAIFATKQDSSREYYSVEFFEGFDGRDCSSYVIVKTNLRHNQQADNLRKCDNLNYEFGNSRTTNCVKVDGKSQYIRSTTVGSACNALAYQ